MMKENGFWRTLRLSGGLLLLFLLAACASVRPSPERVPTREALVDFQLDGRFSLLHEDKSYSGRLSWRHVGANNEVLLSSPFGQGMAEIVTDAAGARLKMRDGQLYAADNVESLTYEVLGYPLPLSRLVDWVRGRVSGEGVERDQLGRLHRVSDGVWQIEYGYEGEDAGAPPSRVFVRREAVLDLRLRIDTWQVLPTMEGMR